LWTGSESEIKDRLKIVDLGLGDRL